MSEFISGVITGAFIMFAWLIVMLFAWSACKVAGDADRQAEQYDPEAR